MGRMPHASALDVGRSVKRTVLTTSIRRRRDERLGPNLRRDLRPVMAKTEKAGLAAHRQALLAEATGDVLEIGAGTGANLLYYGEGVRTLTLTEPEKPMVRRLQKRHPRAAAGREAAARARRGPALQRRQLRHRRLDARAVHRRRPASRPARDCAGSCDPGGRLLFIEHVRSEDEKLARLQDRMLPINSRIGHGCHCNRPPSRASATPASKSPRLEHDTLKHAPRYIRPLIVGTAEPALASRQVSADEPEFSSV